MRQRNLRRFGLGLVLGVFSIGLFGTAWGVNSVVVESKSIAQGGTAGVTIGIFLTNDIPIKNYVIPLEIRAVSGDAFITSLKRSIPSGTRLDGKLTGIRVSNQYEAMDDTNCVAGGIPGGRQGFKTITSSVLDTDVPVVASPEALLYSIGKIFDPDLPAGDDGATPQLLLTVTLGNSAGSFEIDSTCTSPANHLIFVKSTGTPSALLPNFTKGVISVLAADVQALSEGGIPHDYTLDQNYPNPFNASTVIRFNTKHDGHVKLVVYNVLGQQVKTLVDEFRHYGLQAADWDGTDVNGLAVPTGLYFYRLTTSEFTQVKKMVLLK